MLRCYFRAGQGRYSERSLVLEKFFVRKVIYVKSMASGFGVPIKRGRLAALICIFVASMVAGCASDDGPGPQTFANQLAEALNTATIGVIAKTPETGTIDAVTQYDEIISPISYAVPEAGNPVQVTDVSQPTDRNNVGSQATATLTWNWVFGEGETWTYATEANIEMIADTGGGSPGWAVAWDPNILVPGLAAGERISVQRAPATRGYILDGAGLPLVVPRAVYVIGIDKTFVGADQWESAARQLVDLIGSVGYQFDADNYVNKVNAAGDRAFVELITLRQENSPVTRADVEHINGARALDQTKDLAPTATFARPMLGSVGEATAELIDASDGRIVAGDTTGLSGLQRYYDEQLAGEAGITVVATNPYGDSPRELFRVEPVDGISLETTFAVAAQEKAEAILAQVEPAAAIVAIRPSTGEVLVAANGPGSGAFNTALLGQYPPGSTFKVVDALALYRHGVDVNTPVQCPESITVDGRVFQNVPGYPSAALGEVPFRTAFANSCNTAFIGQADLVPERDLAAAGADLGLGVYAPVGIGAAFGDVPAEATGTTHAANLLGQGTIQGSPFAMARVAASVAAGHRVDPVLVRPVTPLTEVPNQDEPASALTEDEAAFLRQMMSYVVSEGSAGILANIPGIVGAKTGTAQFGDGSQNHTWMIAIMDNTANGGDQVAVAVFVELGEFGATTSGPLMHEFLQFMSTQTP